MYLGKEMYEAVHEREHMFFKAVKEYMEKSLLVPLRN